MKFFLRNLNLNPYSLHPTNIYDCEVTIIPSVC